MFRFDRLRNWWRQFSSSLAFKLSLIYGVSGLMVALFVLSFIYLQTMGALHGHHFRQVNAMAKRVSTIYEARGREGLIEALRYDSSSRTHLSSDLLLMVDKEGKKILGNIDEMPSDLSGQDYFPELRVLRNNRSIEARLKKIKLAEGDTILVGQDLLELADFRNLIGRTSFLAVIFGLFFTIVSTYWFRYELGASASAIRRTAEAIRAGRFKQRIPVPTDNHELNLLSKELNHMLDYIESSLKGVRHVSDTIAHNLRTPIMRLRAILSPAARTNATPSAQQAAIEQALDELQRLSILFDKLLQIAEMESGVQRQNWQTINVNKLLVDITELYEPLATEQGKHLYLAQVLDATAAHPTQAAAKSHSLCMLGDPDLLMSALSNLVDNAIKYTHSDIYLDVFTQGDQIVISVKDNGPGVPDAERELLTTHFYRAEHTCDVPGTGLGLTSVIAITRFLRGELYLLDAQPGLEVQLHFPAAEK